MGEKFLFSELLFNKEKKVEQTVDAKIQMAYVRFSGNNSHTKGILAYFKILTCLLKLAQTCCTRILTYLWNHGM